MSLKVSGSVYLLRTLCFSKDVLGIRASAVLKLMDVPFKRKRALESNSSDSECPGPLRTSLGICTRDLFMCIITAGPGPPLQFWMGDRVDDKGASPLLLSQNLIKMDIWGSFKGKELP